MKLPSVENSLEIATLPETRNCYHLMTIPRLLWGTIKSKRTCSASATSRTGYCNGISMFLSNSPMLTQSRWKLKLKHGWEGQFQFSSFKLYTIEKFMSYNNCWHQKHGTGVWTASFSLHIYLSCTSYYHHMDWPGVHWDKSDQIYTLRALHQRSLQWSMA